MLISSFCGLKLQTGAERCESVEMRSESCEKLKKKKKKRSEDYTEITRRVK